MNMAVTRMQFDSYCTAGTAITHFQQVEAKGAIFWEPLVFAIGLCEAYRVSVGWAPPTSEASTSSRMSMSQVCLLLERILMLSAHCCILKADQVL